MFRPRLKNLTTRHARAYVAPQPTPNPKKDADNTLMYVALGLAAAGGAYFYFKNPEDVQDLRVKAKQEAEQVKRRGRETVDAVKSRAGETVRDGEVEYDQLKAEGKAKLDDVRSAAGHKKERDLEPKYDAATEKKAFSPGAEKKAEEAKAGWFSWLGK